MDHPPTAGPAETAPALTATLFVCVTCRLGGADDDALPRAGRRLHDALVDAQQRQGGHAVRIVPAECLSNCNRACSIALTGPGRWTYVYGNLTAEAAADILAGAALYAATGDGLVPWRERPEALRRGLTARIPPLSSS